MDKGGGSSRLISTLMRRTGGDGDVFLDKSSKKEKLRRLSSVGLLGEMNQLSHSINTNSTTKRVEVSKKFYNHCGAIDHASPPRKLRSAMKRRESENGGLTKDCTKKQKPIAEELKMSSVMTKDEEEVAEALFALAQTGVTTSPQVEVKPVVVEESMPPIPNGKKSLNRCSIHVYICGFIKLLKTKIDQGSSNQVISDTNPQNITNNDYADDIADRPKTTTETTTSQDLMGLHATNPTFNSPQQVVANFEHDHSQWSTQQLTSTGCYYQNWQNQRQDRMASVSDSKGSLLQVFGSNTEQERGCISMASEKGKMQSSDCPSGYDEKGGLFSMLNLTL